MTRVVILCNGAFPTTDYPLYLLDSAEGVVCCDGAVEKFLSRYPDRTPLAIVGDMDSISDQLREKFAHVLVHYEEQDYNDQTKAMRWVLENHPEVEEITILGATGLREDHTIGNLGLLMEYTRMFDLGGRRIQIVSDYGTAFAISSAGLEWPTDDVVFDAWWKATLNRTTEPIVQLTFSHPAPALIIID